MSVDAETFVHRNSMLPSGVASFGRIVTTLWMIYLNKDIQYIIFRIGKTVQHQKYRMKDETLIGFKDIGKGISSSAWHRRMRIDQTGILLCVSFYYIIHMIEENSSLFHTKTCAMNAQFALIKQMIPTAQYNMQPSLFICLKYFYLKYLNSIKYDVVLADSGFRKSTLMIQNIEPHFV